ncbi:hypothetical protein AKJ57_01870 [candidate division MSBL1 archaeon SCGC-AAA259A05]|uniref:PIN domain-containing protein n=1 Tax=candidate division MSBL1 archaeon SCGC-AAA259A05 TaxID=1698259 RepID=A0A133UAS1_9EURY|nr:hypothetical protein AKJ57_01870 [candidate division MSBL1 archaeon SCGC-AAA259A05]
MGRIGLDSNVFLCVLLPGATKTSRGNIDGSERVLKSLSGTNKGITSSIVLAEIAWAFLREGKGGPEMEGAKEVIEGTEGLEINPVDPHIAWRAGKLRGRHYEKESPISYQDTVYLATSLREKVDALYTTDPHLLKLEEEEIPIVEPKDFNDQRAGE